MKISEITLGQTVYRIGEVRHWVDPTRKRLTMIDADGIEWHRYDSPTITYHIETLTVVGKATSVLEGEVDENEYVDEVIVKNIKNGNKDNLTVPIGEEIEDIYSCIGDAEAERQLMTQKLAQSS